MYAKSDRPNIKEMYQRVLEKFPDIKEGELSLRVTYDPTEILSLVMIDIQKYELTKEIVIDPAICFGFQFSTLNKEEKQAAIAHELGHYRRIRRYSFERLKRNLRWIEAANEEMDLGLRHFTVHQRKRLVKYHMLGEIYADTQAAKAGYGQQLINFLKRFENEIQPEEIKQEDVARIKNLEKRLGEEKWE